MEEKFKSLKSDLQDLIQVYEKNIIIINLCKNVAQFLRPEDELYEEIKEIDFEQLSDENQSIIGLQDMNEEIINIYKKLKDLEPLLETHIFNMFI